MYAVVDVETTGGNKLNNKITEIGIVITDGTQILQTYTTLINPERKIDRFVVKLTGITDEMCLEAPTFEQVFPEIELLLRDKVFVAHNVHFDYNIVNNALRNFGISLGQDKICTYQLAKRTFPHLPSYSLSNLCKSLDIKLTKAHRAMDDAIATAELFQKIILENPTQALMNLSNIDAPHIDFEIPEEWQLNKDCIPSEPSIIHFYHQDALIFIERAKNPVQFFGRLLQSNPKKTLAFPNIKHLIDCIEFETYPLTSLMEIHYIRQVNQGLAKLNKPVRAMKYTHFLSFSPKDNGKYDWQTIKLSQFVDNEQPRIPCPNNFVSNKIINQMKRDIMSQYGQVSRLEPNEEEPLLDIALYNKIFLDKFLAWTAPIKRGILIFAVVDTWTFFAEVKDFMVIGIKRVQDFKAINKDNIDNSEIVYSFEPNYKISKQLLRIINSETFKILPL
jgi:DNA polymerase III epsilon subunit family exonuclease